MPTIDVKLFASLTQYLPNDARQNRASMDCAGNSTVASVLSDLKVPTEHCHLVVVNGVFVPPDKRNSTQLVDGDTLAVWPPVAGG